MGSRIVPVPTRSPPPAAARASFPGLNEAERANHFGELIYPNLMLSLSRDHVAAFVLHPVASDHTTIDCQLLFHPDEVARHDFDGSDAFDFWHMVNLQDWAICERVQRGMASRIVRPWLVRADGGPESRHPSLVDDEDEREGRPGGKSPR